MRAMANRMQMYIAAFQVQPIKALLDSPILDSLHCTVEHGGPNRRF